ncbi:hypothetical protein FOMPIDRAFT_1136658, partial [Fomitopsis schrenkii]
RSDKMAELARNYHNTLQTEGILPEDNEERNRSTQDAIRAISTKATDEHRAQLEEKVTNTEVKEALKRSENGKAAGLDGIPYEFWKTLQRKYDQCKEQPNPFLDCAELLRLAYNDLEDHGVDPDTGFAEGWMLSW